MTGSTHPKPHLVQRRIRLLVAGMTALLTSAGLLAAPTTSAFADAPAPATTYTVSSIQVGGTPRQIVYSPVDDKVFVAETAGAADEAQVSVIDPGTGTVTAVIPLEADAAPQSIALDAGSDTLYVGLDSGDIEVVSTATNQVTGSLNPNQLDANDCPCGPSALVWDSATGRLLMGNGINQDPAVYAINPVAQTMAPAFFLSAQPLTLAMNTDLDDLYVGTDADISAVDATTYSVLSTASTSVGSDLSVGTGEVYFMAEPTGPDGGAFSTFDPSAGTVTSSAATVPNIGGSDLDPNSGAGGVLYVSDNSDATVIPIDIAAGSSGAPITVGAHPVGVAVDTSDSAVYVANAADGTVSVIERSDTTPTATILSADPNPAVTGQTVTYTATVSPNPQVGSVTYTEPDANGDGGVTIICSGGSLDSSTGSQTCTTTYSATGTHVVSAHYNGSSGFDPSASSPVTEQVTAAIDHPITSTSLSASSTFLRTGEIDALTATVTGATVSSDPGRVAFTTTGGTAISGCSVVTVNAQRRASCTTSWPTTGSKLVTAAYTDPNGPDESSTSSGTNITVVAHQASLTLASAHATIGYGSSDRLYGTVHADGTRYNTSGLRVSLQYHSGSGWHLIATVTSVTGGAFSTSVKPAHDTIYRAVYAGSATLLGATSASRTVHDASTVTIAASSGRIRVRATMYFTGRVGPSQRGKQVLLQRYSGRAWHTVKSGTISSTSHYRIAMRPTTHTDYYWRVCRPATTANAAGASAKVKVTVL